MSCIYCSENHPTLSCPYAPGDDPNGMIVDTTNGEILGEMVDGEVHPTKEANKVEDPWAGRPIIHEPIEEDLPVSSERMTEAGDPENDLPRIGYTPVEGLSPDEQTTQLLNRLYPDGPAKVPEGLEEGAQCVCVIRTGGTAFEKLVCTYRGDLGFEVELRFLKATYSLEYVYSIQPVTQFAPQFKMASLDLPVPVSEEVKEVRSKIYSSLGIPERIFHGVDFGLKYGAGGGLPTPKAEPRSHHPVPPVPATKIPPVNRGWEPNTCPEAPFSLPSGIEPGDRVWILFRTSVEEGRWEACGMYRGVFADGLHHVYVEYNNPTGGSKIEDYTEADFYDMKKEMRDFPDQVHFTVGPTFVSDPPEPLEEPETLDVDDLKKDLGEISRSSVPEATTLRLSRIEGRLRRVESLLLELKEKMVGRID